MKRGKILYVYRTARKKIYERVQQGLEPDHILYGFKYIKQKGWDVFFSDIGYSRLNILFWLFLPIQKLIIYKTTIGFKLDQAILLLPKIKHSDLIITTTDSVGLPLLFLKKLKIINKPIIYISIGLANELVIRKKSFMYKFYLDLLNKANIIICHSLIEKDLFEDMSDKLLNKIKFIPFGIDSSFFKIKKKTGKYILSIGQDKSRDYELLAILTRIMKNQNFVIITQKTNVQNIYFEDNVELKYNIPYWKVKEYYLKAKLVVIPLKEMNRASGQITFLESIASGNKIVIANTKGIVEAYPFIFMSKNKNIYTYKNGKIKSLKRAVNQALKNKDNLTDFPAKYTSYVYGKKIEKLIFNL